MMEISIRLFAVLLFAFANLIFAGTLRGDADGYKVQQIHMAQGKDPTSMTISWVTKSDAQSTVKYGTTNAMTLSADGVKSSYSFDYPQYGVYESGVIHHVFLSGLKPDTVYYYKCGDFSTGDTSGDLTFRTLPAVGNLNTIKFGVIGDLGTTTDSESTLHHLLQNNDLRMILHAGDLSYADCQQPVWDEYGVMVEDLAKQRPWMTGPGNHEIEYTNEGSMYLAFEERYKMPAVKPAEYGPITIPAGVDPSGNVYCASSVFQSEYNYGNSFFSFDAASAHIVYINPYSTSDENSAQYQWLAQDLASVNRSVTPWIVVVTHCPWYNSNTAHHDEQQTVEMRAAMEPLLYKNKVNLVITGHVHAYERTYPVYQNQTVSDGIVYIVIGDGGNREGHAATYYEQPSWSSYRNGTQYGHAELTLQNKDKLTWQWFRNVDGEIVDKDEITLCNSYFHKDVNTC